jgi:hypothetical protein
MSQHQTDKHSKRKIKMVDGKKEITVTLELQKLSVIVNALQELPYKVSSELILEIQEKVGEFIKNSDNAE